MKLLWQRSWAVGAGVGLLLACSSTVDSADNTGGAGSNPGSGGSNPSGGSTANGGSNPSGGSTVNPSGGSTVSAGTTSVAGSGGAGGTTSANLCSNYGFWDNATTYPIGSKVAYKGVSYIAVNGGFVNPDGTVNGGDPTAMNVSLDPQISTWWWQPSPCEGEVPMGTGGTSGGSNCVQGAACARLDSLMNGAKFCEIFSLPCNNQVNYSFDALCEAVGGFTSFANSGDVAKDKRELAAFLAHAAKETWFLHYTRQNGCTEQSGTECGRGPIQITGGSNYEGAGSYLGLPLTSTPDLVATDAVVGWKVALWYWNIHSNPGAGSPGVCHDAMNQSNFGQTTRIINGGVECNGDSASSCQRAAYYVRFCKAFGLTDAECTSGITLDCNGGTCGDFNGECG
jgi:predicted chitinase